MNSLFRMVFCLLLLTGWGLAALSLHVIRTSNALGFLLIPKNQLGITDTYVDARDWTMKDARQHPVVVKRVIETGNVDQLGRIDGRDGNDLKGRLTDVARRAPRANKDLSQSSWGQTQATATAVEQWWDNSK